MTLRSSDLQWDSDLDSIRNSYDVLKPCALGDRRPGKPNHWAEQRDGRVEGGEQRQPQRHQQAQGQPSRDKHSTGKLISDHLVPWFCLHCTQWKPGVPGLWRDWWLPVSLSSVLVLHSLPAVLAILTPKQQQQPHHLLKVSISCDSLFCENNWDSQPSCSWTASFMSVGETN